MDDCSGSIMELDFRSSSQLLQSCKTHHSIQQGRQIHLLLLKRGVLHSALFLGNCLLQMYTRCGSLWDAQQLFGEMPHKNCFSWNTLIDAHLKSGNKGTSLELFNSMPCRNEFSWNAVILSFAKSGDLEVARRLFYEMPIKSGIAWNSLIHGYAQHGHPREALRLFKDLSLQPADPSQNDTFVLATVIGACSNLTAIDCGKQIHNWIVVNEVEFDVVLGSSLVNMYVKCGDLDSATHVLNSMQEPDGFSLSALISGYANCGSIVEARRIFESRRSSSVVLWNAMIAGYVANDKALEALDLFDRMWRDGIREDSSTFASVLKACMILSSLQTIKLVHPHGYKLGAYNDIVVSSVLIDAYSKCGNPGDACKFFSELEQYDTVLLNSMITVYSSCGRISDAISIFETMPSRSLISWNSMIVGYSQNGCAIEAVDLFCEMHRLDLRSDEVSVASVISACTKICSLALGEQIFARAFATGLSSEQIISTSIIDLYCKCGDIENGRRMFDEMVKSDVVSWNSMLMGYAINGFGIEALNLFHEMRHGGVSPNDITFTGVLSACDHCGLVEEGKGWFHLMKQYYHIDPGIEHYSCMVNLFSRAGFLKEAMNLMNQMPFEADASMLSSVLRGCMAHGEEALGSELGERIMKLEPENSSPYVQLSGIFATSGDWRKSEQVRNIMRNRRIRKIPGYSWVDH